MSATCSVSFVLESFNTIIEEEEFIDEKAKEEFNNLLEQYREQGVEIPDAKEPDFTLYNCKIKRTKKHGKIKIESVPPEEFLIDRNAKTIDDADFVSHKKSSSFK